MSEWIITMPSHGGNGVGGGKKQKERRWIWRAERNEEMCVCEWMCCCHNFWSFITLNEHLHMGTWSRQTYSDKGSNCSFYHAQTHAHTCTHTRIVAILIFLSGLNPIAFLTQPPHRTAPTKFCLCRGCLQNPSNLSGEAAKNREGEIQLWIRSPPFFSLILKPPFHFLPLQQLRSWHLQQDVVWLILQQANLASLLEAINSPPMTYDQHQQMMVKKHHEYIFYRKKWFANTNAHPAFQQPGALFSITILEFYQTPS